MSLRQCLLVLLCVAGVGSAPAIGQSKTTEALHKKHSEALSLYFYNNTLRMLNQTEDKTFDELIKDIEKMKFIMIDKGSNFDAGQYKALVSGYKSESFEEIMTSRYQGRNFDVFLKDDKGKTEGMIVTVSDSTSLYVLDIVGSVALDKITTLFKTIDESTDIREKIKNFAEKN
ncbi:DUF4252 domain-containing protein [Chryseolinea sp. T2]|uniref:DUF4252 domain-containing protein n=1 Tax=Chryseolinea sp. T2 TaxID=3129255 RepID=UPI003077A8EB